MRKRRRFREFFVNPACKSAQKSKAAFGLEGSKMRYTIGDVSRVLGMTTSALHFYEKEGVIDTPKEESGRRYYEVADINRLISAKKYRTMGVPIRDIAQQFGDDGMTSGQVLDRMRQKRDEAQRMAHQYEGLARDIDRLIALCEAGLASGARVDIRQAEDMLLLRSESGAWIPTDKREQAAVQRWLEAMPAVSLSISREKDAGRACMGLMVPAARAEALGLKADGRLVQFVPGGMALHAFISCGEEQYDQPDVIFRPILAFARAHRFVQKGTMWGNQLVVDCSGGVRHHYYDTYMQFE